MLRPPRTPTLFPYTTLFRSDVAQHASCLQRTEGDDLRHLLPAVALLHILDHLTAPQGAGGADQDRKSTRLNSSHEWISYAVFCLKKKTSTKQKLNRGAKKT